MASTWDATVLCPLGGDPAPAGGFHTACEAGPGSDGKHSLGGEWHREQSPIVPRPRHGRVTSTSQPVAACWCWDPGWTSAIHPHGLFVCQHVTCRRRVTPEGGDFSFSVVVFVQSQNICVPTGVAPGCRAQDTALGSQREGGTQFHGEGSCWNLAPVVPSPPQFLLLIHRHVCARRRAPSLLPNKVEKPSKFSIARGRER